MHNLIIADPTYDTLAPVDLLIGADHIANDLLGDSSSLGPKMPTQHSIQCLAMYY